MKNLITRALVLLTISTAVNAQQMPSASMRGAGKSTSNERCGMVYGEAHAFTVCAPKGWVLDNTILNDHGIYAVFYPERSSWNMAKDTGTVMYVNTAGKQGENASVSALMTTDAEDTKHNAPASVVKACEPIKLESREEPAAPVQCFTPGAYRRFEAVAYIDSPKIIVMVVMTSNNERSFKRDYPAFEAVVKSYSFLSSNVDIQHQ